MAERATSDKLSHSQVDYESPSAHDGERCARCRHFIFGSPPRCEAVASPIHWNDWCRRFEARE